MLRQACLPVFLVLLFALVLVLPHAQAVKDVPGFPSGTVEKITPKIERASRDDDAVTFCVFGDTRPAGNPKRLAITTAVARAMAAEHPSFVLGTGDYIDGNARTVDEAQAQWNAFFSSLEPLQKYGPVPMAAAIGNHDGSGGTGSFFAQYFGRTYRSFDIEDAHFIILDTEQPGHVGRIEGDQWQWLCDDLLAAQQSPLIFVVLHQPLFPVGLHRGSSLDAYPKQRDRLHLLFAQYKVNAVFQGHEHQFNHEVRDGVRYFISGGGGAPLYARPSNGGFYHYLRVQFSGREYTVDVRHVAAPD